MKIDTFDKIVEILTKDRKEVSKGKREDYTKGDSDVLANFKNQAREAGITPLQSLFVHMEKQISAVFNYIKTGGEHESEPIIKRIGDSINYLELLWGLINDKEVQDWEGVNIDIESVEYWEGRKKAKDINLYKHPDLGEIYNMMEEATHEWKEKDPFTPDCPQFAYACSYPHCGCEFEEKPITQPDNCKGENKSCSYPHCNCKFPETGRSAGI